MALVIGPVIEGLVALLPFVAAYFVLGGSAHKDIATIEQLGGAITAGPVNTAVNAWIKVLAVGAIAGLGIWIVEVESSKRLGVAAPAAPNLAPGAPSAPTFGATGGYTLSGGPFSTSSGVTAGNAPAPRPPAAAPRRGGSTFGSRRR